MKIRFGFVSNSSSSSFILGTRNGIIKDISAFLEQHENDINQFIKGSKSNQDWKLMEEWNIPFNKDTITEVMEQGAKRLDEEGLEIIMHSIHSELLELTDKDYVQEFEKEIIERKADGLELYQIYLNHSDLPDKFIIDFFIHTMNDDVKEKDLYLRYLPWEY